MSGEELVARCFCHELEHLDGHLFVEHTGELYSPDEIDAMEAAEEDEARKRPRRKGKKR